MGSDFLTIDQALNFIHGFSPTASEPDLSRMADLLARLGSPEKRLRAVHIAGTNGKGSTAAMLACVMTSAGFRTGLFTSPYISRFNERMRINGLSIPDDELARLSGQLAGLMTKRDEALGEFEIVTALAFMWFAQKRCDIVILEVGIGGRLDPTNFINAPECAVITNIGLDHTRLLGDTVEKIAAEKARIIKPGSVAVMYEQEQSVIDVIKRRCDETEVKLRIPDFAGIESVRDSVDGQVFRYKDSEYGLSLLGAHQLRNAATSLEAVSVLRERGWSIPESAVRLGLAEAVWPARFEIVSRRPWFVVDGGHNPQCAEAVAASLRAYFPGIYTVMLIGTLRDKDFAAITAILDGVAGEYIAVAPDNPRALPAAELGAHLAKYGKSVLVCDSIEYAVELSKSRAGRDGVVCAVGSLYMAGAIRECFIKGM